jgi:hypothetical protein
MSKNPKESALPSARQAKVLDAVNTVIQNSLLIILDAATSTCKCPTCETARKTAPKVRVLLEMGRVGKIEKV